MATARGCALGVLLAVWTLPSAAQTTDQPVPAPAAPVAGAEHLTFGTQNRPGRAIYFSAALGAQVSPEYFGSDEMEFGPSFRGGLAYFNFLGVDFGETDFAADPYSRGSGFGLGLSFRFIQARDSDDYDELDGLDDIDPTLEIGGAFGYVWPNVEAIADLRYGFGGSDAWVGELRANYVTRPTDRLSIRIGPRLLFGSDNYVDTYFGVSEAESARSGLDAFDPDAGLVSAGVEAIATYQLADRWWVEGAVKWQHFEDDAGDSPIVRQGSSDYTRVRIGIRRAFVLRF